MIAATMAANGRLGISDRWPAPRIFEPVFDKLEDMIEFIDRLIIAEADRVGNSADKRPDRAGAVKGDKLISLVPPSDLCLHDAILSLSAE